MKNVLSIHLAFLMGAVVCSQFLIHMKRNLDATTGLPALNQQGISQLIDFQGKNKRETACGLGIFGRIE
ncbi:MAG: hypothetical protein OEZ57_01235 [Nitrospirota bacterium]|nr:hypothetical protein [Nitrospirota bacterium]MDH5585078.1 hypothetical protein [Nitrospirota bacterium]MDH5773523.1 hypothetical protein [Nitrospirota bacterium]